MKGQQKIDLDSVFHKLNNMTDNNRVNGETLILDNISRDRGGITVTIMNRSIGDSTQTFRITPTEIHTTSMSRQTTPSENFILDITGRTQFNN